MRPWRYLLSLVPILSPLAGCAHAPGSSETRSELEVARDHILKLEEKVADLETRMVALNEKVTLETSANPKSPLAESPAVSVKGDTPATAPVKSLPTEVVSAPAAASKATPQAKIRTKPAFSSNESVDRFREAKILFDSKRYPDAVLEFSDFVKNEPDHALAPAAQYYLGMSYLKQGEYKLAEEEFSRGMLAYPHSSHIPDTLLALIGVSSELKKSSKVAYYREKLLSQFPNSPQAKSVASNQAAPPAGEPVVIESKPKKSVESPDLPAAPVNPSLEEGADQ